MKKITTVDGDRLDLICYAEYGTLSGRIVEQVLESNPEIARDETFHAGKTIILPDIEAEPQERSLW